MRIRNITYLEQGWTQEYTQLVAFNVKLSPILLIFSPRSAAKICWSQQMPRDHFVFVAVYPGVRFDVGHQYLPTSCFALPSTQITIKPGTAFFIHCVVHSKKSRAVNDSCMTVFTWIACSDLESMKVLLPFLHVVYGGIYKLYIRSRCFWSVFCAFHDRRKIIFEPSLRETRDAWTLHCHSQV